MKQEATYIFEYSGKQETVYAFVDPIENRRYWDTAEMTLPVEHALNYKGVGNEEVQTFYPEIVYEEENTNMGRGYEKFVSLIFHLPDVDAYAVGTYSILNEADERFVNFEVRLLDKLV